MWLRTDWVYWCWKRAKEVEIKGKERRPGGERENREARDKNGTSCLSKAKNHSIMCCSQQFLKQVPMLLLASNTTIFCTSKLTRSYLLWQVIGNKLEQALSTACNHLSQLSSHIKVTSPSSPFTNIINEKFSSRCSFI